MASSTQAFQELLRIPAPDAFRKAVQAGMQSAEQLEERYGPRRCKYFKMRRRKLDWCCQRYHVDIDAYEFSCQRQLAMRLQRAEHSGHPETVDKPHSFFSWLWTPCCMGTEVDTMKRMELVV
ncbi:unnamed protein product [Symbiodinium sp. CCMP2592]|nr:unnamed protein product [Symbiodinium sp. CCMP2592]